MPTPKPQDEPVVPRRLFLGALGLGGLAAFLPGCQSEPDRVVTTLPDPLSPSRAAGQTIVSDRGYAPPAPSGSLRPPITPKEPVNSYGILPRSMWTREGPDLSRVDPMGGVNLITFHHSGDPRPFTSTDFAETAQHLEYVREYHRSRNFQDIGYHFAIDRAGRVWQLRPLQYEGQHVRYNNEHNIGVVCLGNFDLQSMSAAQKEKARSFGQLLRHQYGLSISQVKTHKEIVKTECPGNDMQPYIKMLRDQKLI